MVKKRDSVLSFGTGGEVPLDFARDKLLAPLAFVISLSTGGEARTPDTWFWRPVLYQLSYTRFYGALTSR